MNSKATEPWRNNLQLSRRSKLLVQPLRPQKRPHNVLDRKLFTADCYGSNQNYSISSLQLINRLQTRSVTLGDPREDEDQALKKMIPSKPFSFSPSWSATRKILAFLHQSPAAEGGTLHQEGGRLRDSERRRHNQQEPQGGAAAWGQGGGQGRTRGEGRSCLGLKGWGRMGFRPMAPPSWAAWPATWPGHPGPKARLFKTPLENRNLH